MDSQLLQPLGDPRLANIPTSNRSTSIREKLADLWGSTDFVRVINPDIEAHVWQYMPESKEHISFDTSSSTVPMKNTYREPPEVYRLEPGQSAVLIGGNAYMMVESLVKKMMAKKTISRNPNVKPGEARNFNFSDDSAQTDWIPQIYLGKVNPTAVSTVPSHPAAVIDDLDDGWADPNDTTLTTGQNMDSISNDLGITDAKPIVRRRRRKSSTAGA